MRSLADRRRFQEFGPLQSQAKMSILWVWSAIKPAPSLPTVWWATCCVGLIIQFTTRLICLKYIDRIITRQVNDISLQLISNRNLYHKPALLKPLNILLRCCRQLQLSCLITELCFSPLITIQFKGYSKTHVQGLTMQRKAATLRLQTPKRN